MGNKVCYSNTHRRIRNNTSALIDIPQRTSRGTQYHIFHDKSPVQEITPVDIKQKHLIDLFLVPYYNIEILADDVNSEQECAICFEPFCKRDIVARLECLCIYHKKCLDEWGRRKRCCPLHMEKILSTNTSKFISSSRIIQDERQ